MYAMLWLAGVNSGNAQATASLAQVRKYVILTATPNLTTVRRYVVMNEV